MEKMITIPREKYEKMLEELKLVRELEKIDLDLIRQFKESLEDVREGRIIRVA